MTATPGYRTCSRCARTAPEQEFPLRRKDGAVRQPYCRACKADYQRAWYEANRERHIRNVIERNRAHRATIVEVARRARDRPCADCGRTYPPEVMDFDHRRGTKVANISEMLQRNTTVIDLIAEIAKCDIVCANCHRERTYGPTEKREE